MPATSQYQIGGISLSSRVILAPMAGYTDLPFRLLARRFGAALAFTEMVSAEGIRRGHKRTLEYLRSAETDHPVGAQIFGANPQTMAEAARIIADHGFDLLDINMGCPVPKVVKNGAGAALMKRPEEAISLLETVVRASPIPVTVKMRAGWDEDVQNAVTIACGAERAGVTAVTVHPRTRVQLFSGVADWNVIKCVKEQVSIPVVGSGDVRSGSEAQRLLDNTGCDFVMVGRAALGSPWVFELISTYLERGESLPPPPARERVELALEHFRLACQHYPARRAAMLMKKHLGLYLRGLEGVAELRSRVNRGQTAEEIIAIINQILTTLEAKC